MCGLWRYRLPTQNMSRRICRKIMKSLLSLAAKSNSEIPRHHAFYASRPGRKLTELTV